MKHFIVTVGIVLTAVTLFAQNDGANAVKYWKFRTDFREKYIKIGSNQGESLPAGSLKPLDCVDNINYDGTGFGEMHWGDGMIRHGHYLGLLATEYRLLKNAGKDVSGVLNELYFALKAVNRLDRNAEAEQAPFYDFTQSQNLNGFYLREDVYEDFATTHWGSDPIEMRCTNSAYYKNNNAAKMNAQTQWGEWESVGNSYQNVPSQDQLSSLLVGFSLVDKLVDNVFVKPEGETQGFYIVSETEAIVDRLVSYCADHNWFMIDVNGWPTNNGGADLIISAHPILLAAQRITGNPYFSYNTAIQRRTVNWKEIYYCLTGFGLNAELSPEDQFLYCEQLTPLQSLHSDMYLSQGVPAGTFNNQDISAFQAWQNGGAIAFETDDAYPFWSSILPEGLGAIYDDWADDHIYNNSFLDLFGISEIEFGNPLIKDYSATIIFNLGVASGMWNSSHVHSWANGTGNRQLELINAILNNQTPTESQAFYRSYLDGMPMEGPYHLRTAITETSWVDKMATNGWASEYRWTHPAESVGDGIGRGGIYSGLDYMLYHNLYWLLFNNGSSFTETTDQCPCGNDVTVTYNPAGDPAIVSASQNLNQKLSYLPTCVPNALEPTFNMVTTTFTVQPKFSNYSDWNIFPTKYQTMNATVEPNGILKTRTRFVLCASSNLNIKAGAEMKVEKGSFVVNSNAVTDVTGTLRIQSGTDMHLRGKLILRAGSKLLIEDNAKLLIDYAGSIEFYNGAQIITYGTGNEITLRGVIKTMDATTFQITNEGSATQSGKLIIDSPNATFTCEQPTYFKLEGKAITDPFITINNGAKLYVQDQDIISFRVANCLVTLNNGASIVAEEPYYSYDVRYNSTFNNGGFTVTDAHVLHNCTFWNVPVKANMNIENTAPFSADNCSFLSSSSTLNTNDVSLVKVTGMGVSLSNCFFTGNRTYSLNTFGLTQPSYVTGCAFTNTNSSAVGSNLTGIYDISNIEMKVVNSNFQKCLTGINKSNGKLSLKCNVFTNNNQSNVKVRNGCLLNMSINDLAGYNTLIKSLQNKNIEITSCNINLKNGYNFIENCTATISGNTAFTCVPPGCQVDLANNQWNTANTVPATSLFQITSSNSMAVLPLVNTIAAKPACGFYDGPIVIDPPKTKSTFAQDGMPIIWSVIENDSIRLNEAIIGGMELMTSYDSVSGNDLQALARFNEVFASDVNPHDSLTRNYLWYTFDHMKTTLENAYAHGQLQINSNATDFEPEVAMFANALMLMTDSVIDEENYLTQFYHEIDKAHLFRVIGRSDIGLSILTELESCGLDSAEQAHLNHWKMVFSEDLVIEQIGLNALDTTIVIDTTGYISPSVSVNAYRFGAQINGLNDILYPNCNYYNSRDEKWGIHSMNLYPNPATSEVTIKFNHPLMVGEGTVVIQQADGRIVYTKTIDSNESVGLTIRVADWNAGVYQVRYQSPEGVISTAQLVVQ